jgi:uncharacterized protein (DUF433 family)
MTPRKVHHWLHTGLLGEPVRREIRGQPTLLAFEQLLKIAVLQRLRDDLDFSLQRVRAGLTWLLEELVDEDWGDLHFYRTGTGDIGVRDRAGRTFAIGGQLVIAETIPEALTDFVRSIRRQWESGIVPIRGFDLLVSDVEVMGGAPVIVGTRIETTFVAHVARDTDLDDIAMMFDHVSRDALEQALTFEGIAA